MYEVEVTTVVDVRSRHVLVTVKLEDPVPVGPRLVVLLHEYEAVPVHEV